MHKKIVTLLQASILSIQLLQSPVQAKIFNADTTMPDTTVTITALTAAGLYIGYNYLTRQDYLVEKKHPHAYAWYQAMQLKYPGIFDDILFIQTPTGSLIGDTLAKFATTCNIMHHENRIFFDATSLQEIALIYNKVIDGYPLHNNEKLTLALYEFMLLHQAGHIIHQDSRDLMVFMTGLFGALHGTEYAYRQFEKTDTITPQPQATEHKETSNKDDEKNIFAGIELPELSSALGKDGAQATTTLLDTLGLPSKIPGILATGQGLAFITGIIALLRYQEAKADQFACKQADLTTLQQALSLFENDEVDILFELENKTVLPYIPATSAHEHIIQSIAQPLEYTALYAAQQFYLLFKKSAITRWIFDFTQNAIHQGPSIRAAMIHNEIAQRSMDH